MRAAFRRVCVKLLNRAIAVEVIGQEECPLMMRWTFLDLGFVRAMIHYFPPEVTDRDPHDHPRSFFTFVLRGNYIDTSWEKVDLPGQEYMATIELVEAGQLIYRPAKHLHIVETQERGCWTVVVMGPLQREWGFVRLTTMDWWPWGKYVQRFGGVIRCDAPADKMGVETPVHVVEEHWTPETDPTPDRPFRTHSDYRGTPPPMSS